MAFNNDPSRNIRQTKGILFDEKQWQYLRQKYRLSSREVQVAIMLCRGFSTEQMAQTLNIKSGTVKTHLRNLYRRFRVNNKVLLILTIVNDVIEEFYTPIGPVSGRIPIKEIPARSDLTSKLSVKDREDTD